jgi:hypothetical protein
MRQLKCVNASSNDFGKTYISLTRPVLEYACPVLTQEQELNIERVQKRACKIIYVLNVIAMTLFLS